MENGATENVAALSNYSLNAASVLLTGASGGLGNALARELNLRGARLTLAGRSADRLDAVPVDGLRYVGDLRDPSSCQACIETALTNGGLDIVINAVGVVAFGPVSDLSIDAMEELFLTNVFVPIMLAKAALPKLSPDGAIVNLSGVIAEQNLPGMAGYGASKSAVRSFGEGLRREARRSKIRVLDARPPHTETGLATRPIEGTAPKMPAGLAPDHVARVICDALESGTNDLPSTAF